MASFSLNELLGKDTATAYSAEERSVPTENSLAVTCWLYRAASAPADATRPVLVGLHGGPSFCHNYILPLIALCDSGYDVLLYDQAGCGRSSADADLAAHPELLTLEYYGRELSCVLAAYSLPERGYHLYGSSWGTVLAQEHAILQPPGLRSLVLDGALCDAQLYISSQWRHNLSQLPLLTQTKLKALEQSRDFGCAEYKCIEDALTAQFTSRLLPPAQCFLDSLAGHNHAIYVAIQGPSEFAIAGSLLEHWRCTERNAAIAVPALVMRGAFDSMTEECSEAVVRSIPLARPLCTVARAAHCKLCDEPAQCAELIAAFLASVG